MLGVGKAPGSGDRSLNMTSKVDERMSLLADGSKNVQSQENSQADKGPEDNAGLNGRVMPEDKLNNDGTEEAEARPVTKKDIFKRREEILDKALISAVKTLT